MKREIFHCCIRKSKRVYGLFRAKGGCRFSHKTSMRKHYNCLGVNLVSEIQAHSNHFFFIFVNSNISYKMLMRLISYFFRIANNFSHHSHSLHRVFSDCRLTRKHRCISTLFYCIMNISKLSTSWCRVVNHGFKHICCDDNGFSCK